MLLRSLLLLVAIAAIPAEDRITRESITSGGVTRHYYRYVPETLKPDAEAPLLVLLHGSGRDGNSLAGPWKNLAKKEGIILAAPNSTNSQEWHLKHDGPYFIADLVDAVRSRCSVDLKRIYLFGHSAGAIQALMLGLLESEYFAAVAVHAGALPPSSNDLIDMHDRKIPFAIWVGTNDKLFPMAAVDATKAALEKKGLTVLLRPMKNHTHDYYGRSGEVNVQAWDFLQQHRLTENPRFKEYDLK